MAENFTRDQVLKAVNAAADMVSSELELGDRENELLNLMVNAVMTVLAAPNADLSDVVSECYDDDDDPRGRI